MSAAQIIGFIGILVVIVATVIIAAIGIPIFARKAPPEVPKLEPPEEEDKESLEE